MTPDRWQQISSLYQAALEREVNEREAFLQEVCDGDEELRRELEDLLVHHHAAAKFMDAPALDVAAKVLARAQDQRLIGKQLGPYNVRSLLGAGGMGEVYLAQDTRLERQVALKVLPPEVTQDPDRLKRFVREAKAASALNHPNIATIHEIGEAEGTHFISMEYIEGDTLEASIREHRLDLTEILEIGIQIADALEAAHSKGIIHRDIKPSNLMLTERGQVKVLDFGLAKRSYQEGPALEKEIRTESQTTQGLIMGTVDYMSPEQVLGQKVDHRTDLFSLGVVLYDMVTGRLPFRGVTPTDTIGKILHTEPEAMTHLKRKVPAELERIVGKCLEKDRELRYQHASDVRADLGRLKRDDQPATSATQIPRPTPRWAQLLGTALLLTVAIAAAGVWLLRTKNEIPDVPPVPVPLTTYPGVEEEPSFSPDGNQVALMWNGEKQDNEDIYIKQIGNESLRRLTTDPHIDGYPSWSPDGQYIAFLRFSAPGKAGVMLIPVNGGRERQVAELRMRNVEVFSRLLCWHPGGKWLAVSSDQDSADAPSAIYLISVETHEKRRLALPPRGVKHDTSPAFSPDGRSLVFARYSFGDTSELYLLRLSAGLVPEDEVKQLTSLNQDTCFPAWTPDGKEIIFASGSKSHACRLWRVSTHDTGQPRPLPFSSEVNGLDPAISMQKHRLVYVAYSLDSNIWRCEISKPDMKPAPPQRFLASTRVQDHVQYSPDGKAVVYVAWASGNAEIWECDSDGTKPMQLTHLGGPVPGPPRWSPDGKQIVFAMTSEGHTDLYLIPAQGGEMRQLTRTPFSELDPSFSWDGKWIYFSSDRNGHFEVWKMPSEGGEAVLVARNGGFSPQESMDGKMLFYLKPKNTDLHGELWRVPLAGGQETQVLEEVWFKSFDLKRDGIYYAARPNKDRTLLLRYDFAKEKTSPIDTLQKLVGWGLTVSPDEQTILYIQLGDERGELMLVENFR